MLDVYNIIQKTKKYSALCIDDEPSLLLNQAELLGMFFNKIYTAGNAQEGLEIYSKNCQNIDAVFTDINMPVMNGVEFIKSIKGINPLQYITVISARGDSELFKELINQGTNGYLTKPLKSDELISCLNNMLTYFEHALNNKTSRNGSCDLLSAVNGDNSFIFTDHLTGLYSKAKLDECLLGENRYSLILVDVDNMDQINCKYGYNIGDQVLQSVARILKEFEFEKCKIFRLVSDEFVLLFDENDSGFVEEVSKKIIKKFYEKKIQTDVHDIDLTCTIGISRGKGLDLVRQAHIAIKESRQIGKEKFYYFSSNSSFAQKKQKDLKWLKKIKKIIKENSLIPYYQPIFDNKKNKIKKYESLARILEINRIIKPYYFLESAKLFNLIPDVTKIMIENVFKYIADKDYDFAINITAEDMKQDDFIPFVLQKIKKYRINKENIIFEILENTLIDGNDKVLKTLKVLRKEGFQIAVDDFGKESLNLKALHDIKIDYIKIDGVFIESLLEDKKSVKIVESIIKLADSIGAKTVAESVSSKAILEKVKKMGIDYSQGYFIGKPSETIL